MLVRLYAADSCIQSLLTCRWSHVVFTRYTYINTLRLIEAERPLLSVAL